MEKFREIVRRVVAPAKIGVTLATVLLVFLSFTLPGHIMTVKGMLVDSGMAPTNPYFSIDSGRIAFQGGSPTGVVIYDINSSSSISFANPPQPACLFPSISGDKVVVACSNGYQAPQTLYYCILPHSFPMQACGPWTAVLTGLPSIGQHPYPAISGDLVAYSLNNAFGYYRFSTGTNITIRTDYQPHYVTSNGEIIAFTGGSPDTLRYYDTSAPLGQRAIVNTTLSGEYPSISQSTISFSDTTTTPERIRYYDILRNQSSRAGIGPVGIPTPGYAGTSIWDNRIVFKIDEVSAGFDCNGDGTMSSTESCLGYWNIHSPSWVATTLAYSAAPAVNFGGFPVIYDKIIAFQGSNGHMQYVTVPLKGDVNLDGIVDSNDQGIVNSCQGQLLKGTTC